MSADVSSLPPGHRTHSSWPGFDNRSMPRTYRAIHHLVSLVRKQHLPVSQFRLSRVDNHPAKGTLRKLSDPHPLSLAVLIAGQDFGESANQVILRWHERHLLRPMCLQGLGWMDESGGDDFLPAVRSGDKILFGTMREAGERCIAQERDIKPDMEPPTLSSMHILNYRM